MRLLRKYLCLLGAASLGLGTLVFAESIKIANTNFKIDALTELDSQSSKVTLFGQSRIVAKPQLEKYVLEQYALRDGALANLSNQELIDLVKALIDQNKGDLASLLLPELMLNRKLTKSFSELVTIEAESGQSSTILALCKRSLELTQGGAEAQTLSAECLFNLALLESDWLRSNHTTALFRASSQVLDCAQRRVETLLSRFELNASLAVLQAMEVIYGENNQRIHAMRRAQARAEELTRLARDGVSENFVPLLGSTFEDPLIGPIISGFNLRLVHEQAQKLIALGEPARALRLLSMVPLAKRTPTTHQLALSVLTALKGEARDILAEPATSRFLGGVSKHDPEIERHSIEVISARIRELLDQGKPELTERLIQALLVLRPDPSSENDLLRGEQASALLRLQRFAEFDSKLAEFRTALPLSTKFRFWSHRIRNSPAVKLFIILLGLLLIILVLLRLHRARLIAEAKEAQEFIGINEEQEENRGPGFANFRVGLSPRRNEYNQCLAVLGLKSGATIKDIKAAYRTLVKEVHPDRQSSENLESQDKFIELTSIYDRILELRDQLGIVDSPEK